MRFFLCLFYMFHRRYSNCRPLNSSRYNRIICQRVENTSFFERLSCILHALAKGYQGYKSNFRFHVPFDREIWQIKDTKSVFGFAERNTLLVPQDGMIGMQWEHYTSTCKRPLILFCLKFLPNPLTLDPLAFGKTVFHRFLAIKN